MEAFSFRKSVVKISGQWVRFGKDTEAAIRLLSVGDRVAYVVEGRTLRHIEKAQAGPSPQRPQAPPVVPRSAPAQLVPAQAADSRNRSIQGTTARSLSTELQRQFSIERQVALKAAVELAELYSYGSTKECLDVAATFAAWIQDTADSVTGAAAGQAAGFSSPSL